MKSGQVAVAETVSGVMKLLALYLPKRPVDSRPQQQPLGPLSEEQWIETGGLNLFLTRIVACTAPRILSASVIIKRFPSPTARNRNFRCQT